MSDKVVKIWQSEILDPQAICYQCMGCGKIEIVTESRRLIDRFSRWLLDWLCPEEEWLIACKDNKSWRPPGDNSSEEEIVRTIILEACYWNTGKQEGVPSYG
jgi:hypothetical protein